jgi:hypothetical protein
MNNYQISTKEAETILTRYRLSNESEFKKEYDKIEKEVILRAKGDITEDEIIDHTMEWLIENVMLNPIRYKNQKI